MRRATEAAWSETVRALARTTGWACYHTRDSRGSAPGWPDLVLLKPPRCLFRELKVSPRGRPTHAQRAWVDGLLACGLDAAVWTLPDDWGCVVETLTRRTSAP